jgi:hypothetical protein
MDDKEVMVKIIYKSGTVATLNMRLIQFNTIKASISEGKDFYSPDFFIKTSSIDHLETI